MNEVFVDRGELGSTASKLAKTADDYYCLYNRLKKAVSLIYRFAPDHYDEAYDICASMRASCERLEDISKVTYKTAMSYENLELELTALANRLPGLASPSDRSDGDARPF